MSTPTLYITMGLPRSGKSTWARSTGYPIVNRDAIRLALHGQTFLNAAEDMVSAIEEYMVRSLLLAGHTSVVVDATHLNPKHVNRWMEFNVQGIREPHVIPKQFPTGPAECISRAKADGRPDLVPVIESMFERYIICNCWLENDIDREEATCRT